MADDAGYVAALNAHYGTGDPIATLFADLRAAGNDPAALTVDDLAPVDQLHSGGATATVALARLAELQPGTRVLDVGGGLGGPARLLAARFGCAVTVLDLTEAFCRAGEELTRRVGLADRVRFRHGSALDQPFSDAAFDLAWMQHASMNIADKERLFAEIRRVVRPGGRLALHEIVAGPVQPLHFPVPWAADPSLNSLRPADEFRALLAATGFVVAAWVDVTPWTLALARAQMALDEAATDRPAAPGPRSVLGDDLPLRRRTLVRNAAEERVAMIQAVLDRP